MTDLAKNHSAALRQLLLPLGYEFLGELFAFDKLTTFDRNMRIARYRKDGMFFFLTNGCSGHTRNSKFKYEFVIDAAAPEKYYLDLINFVAYFHLTFRDVVPTDLLEIGASFDAVLDFSHIYASVPYFLPNHVNFIEAPPFVLALTWLMPVRHFEAEYIKTHGADAFENKLEHFGLNFFADRSDPSYLDQT